MGGGEVVMRGVYVWGREGGRGRKRSYPLYFLSTSFVVSMRNRCSQLDTVPHPPLLTISSASTTNCLHTHTNTLSLSPTHTHKHKQPHTHIVSWERQSYIAATFSYECTGVYSPAYWGHFTVCFPLCSGCVSCSWVNTWYNQVSLPPLSVCTSVGQLWPWARRSYSAWQSGQRKQMHALTVPVSKQKLIVQKWVILKSSCSLVIVSHALCSLTICRFIFGTYNQRNLGAISLQFNPIFFVLLHLLGYEIWACAWSNILLGSENKAREHMKYLIRVLCCFQKDKTELCEKKFRRIHGTDKQSDILELLQ